MFRKFLFWLASIGLSLSSPAVLACGDYCGLYSTGGYNLLDVSISIYSGLDAAYTSSSGGYSGGCGSFLYSCNSAFDSANLYGSSWGSTSSPLLSITINNDICMNPYSSLYGQGYGMGGLGGLGYGSGLGMYGGGDLACALGYCSGSTNPFMGWPGLSSIDPSIFGGGWGYPYPGMFPGVFPPSLYPQTFPSPTYPTTYLNNPYSVPNLYGNNFPTGIPVSSSGIFTTPNNTSPWLSPSTSPLTAPPTTTVPAYGACDNIFVLCPMSPINPTTAPSVQSPSFNPAPVNPTVPNNPFNPTMPSNHTGNIDPNRGQVPRMFR